MGTGRIDSSIHPELFNKPHIPSDNWELVGNYRSTTYDGETGVAQGSVIAVTIFLVGMNPVVNKLPEDIFPLIYADDIVLLARGRTPAALRRKLQAAVRAVEAWTKTTGYSLSATKNAVTHVCQHRHNPAKNKKVKTSNGTIPFKTCATILGIVITRRFDFETYFVALRANLRFRMNLLRVLASPHHTNNRHTPLRVAKAIVWTKLFYGLEVFCHARTEFFNKLQGTYNQSIRIAAGLLPSTPADSACVELGCLPLRYQFTEVLANRAVSYAAKTTGTYQTHILTEADRILYEMTNQHLPPVAPIIWTGSRRWNEPELYFDTYIENKYSAGAISSVVRPEVEHLLATKYVNYTHNYTDGSKSSTGVGVGAVLDKRESHLKLPDQFYVAIQQHITKRTIIMWIPAHVGIPGNERADNLAKRGQTSRTLHNAIPCQDLKLWFKNLIHPTWELEWKNVRDLFLRKIKRDTTVWTDRENRTEQKKLSRLRVGHTRITHNFKSGTNFHRTCPTCDVKATVEHFLVNCPIFDMMRTKHNLPNNILNILANDKNMEEKLIQFLKDSKIYYDL